MLILSSALSAMAGKETIRWHPGAQGYSKADISRLHRL
jgi:hypothetical protein